jgi:hypothetical protein
MLSLKKGDDMMSEDWVRSEGDVEGDSYLGGVWVSWMFSEGVEAKDVERVGNSLIWVGNEVSRSLRAVFLWCGRK